MFVSRLMFSCSTNRTAPSASVCLHLPPSLLGLTVCQSPSLSPYISIIPCSLETNEEAGQGFRLRPTPFRSHFVEYFWSHFSELEILKTFSLNHLYYRSLFKLCALFIHVAHNESFIPVYLSNEKCCYTL